jgi:hypothetical protein
LKLRVIDTEQHSTSIRMPRCDPNRKLALAQKPNNATAQRNPVPPKTVTMLRLMVYPSSRAAQIGRSPASPAQGCAVIPAMLRDL